MSVRKFSIFLAACAASMASLAADTYSTSTSILTTPLVKVGDTLYKNVTLTLGSVVSVGSTVTAGSYDTYDATTNRLTIPVVNVGSTPYYNVVITVGKVLSTESSCTISSTCSKTGTPEVRGVLPGDGRVSVMFNFMGGKITELLGSNTKYVPANAYEAVCTASDGSHVATSAASPETTAHGNYANPLVVSGLTNGKTYTCAVTATYPGALPATSAASTSVIPNAGSADSSGVLASTVNTAHAKAYPTYSSYCNYTNETATGLSTPPTISYYTSTGTLTKGTSKSTITCSSTTRTITSNALPDHLSSEFFTSGLTGYTGMPYVSGNPNSIGDASVSKTFPLTGTISSAYVKGSAGYDTSACYTYTSSAEPSAQSNTKWVSGPSVWKSGTVRCQWVSYIAFFNNGAKVEPGTAETYVNGGITFKIVGKNLYQDVGMDPSNSHNQPTMTSSGTRLMYGYYHYHGMPEGQISRLGKGNKTMTLVGFAVDGFPVYARYGYTDPNSTSSGVTVMKSNYRVRTAAELAAAGYSSRPSTSVAPYGTFEQDWVYDATSSASNGGHLDACNGRYGVTPESPTTAVYHYFITDSYPFVPRCVFGTPANWANNETAN